MSDAPVTRPSLLLRMRDARDHEAWHTFVDLYAPLVYRFARRRGLQDADAADLTQDVLRLVADVMKNGKYDPGRGSFRGWLHTVTRNAVYKFLRDGRRRPSQPAFPSDVSTLTTVVRRKRPVSPTDEAVCGVGAA